MLTVLTSAASALLQGLLLDAAQQHWTSTLMSHLVLLIQVQHVVIQPVRDRRPHVKHLRSQQTYQSCKTGSAMCDARSYFPNTVSLPYDMMLNVCAALLSRNLSHLVQNMVEVLVTVAEGNRVYACVSPSQNLLHLIAY